MAKTWGCLVGNGHHWHVENAEDGKRVKAKSDRQGKAVSLSLGNCQCDGLTLEGYLRFDADGKLVRRGPEFPNFIPLNTRAFCWKSRPQRRVSRRVAAASAPSLSEPERRELLDGLDDPGNFERWLAGEGPSLL